MVAHKILETAQIPLSLFYLNLGLDLGLGLVNYLIFFAVIGVSPTSTSNP